MSVIIQEFHSSAFHDVELVVQHYAYSAFGKILSIIDGNGNDVTDAPLIQPLHTFTGKIYDVESGLIHFFARMYDPNLGRFIQIDPDQGKNNNPLTFGSKYIYSLNDPINRVDPLGRISFKQTLGLLLIGINPVVGLALVNTEFGHTLQFIALAAGNKNPTDTWEQYAIMGAIGLGIGRTSLWAGGDYDAWYNPWEYSASFAGGGFL